MEIQGLDINKHEDDKDDESEVLQVDDDCLDHVMNFNVSGHGVVRGTISRFGFCSFSLQAPSGTVLYWLWRCCTEDWRCDLELPQVNKKLGCTDQQSLILTKDNNLTVTFFLHYWKKIVQNISFNVEFKVTPQSERGHLSTLYTSATTGIMTSLGFQRGLLYPDDVISWGRIVVPLKHGLMVSVPKLHLASDPIGCLDVFLTDLIGDVKHVQHECGLNIVPAHVYSSVQLVAVNMTSGQNYEGTGFKLLFSFHQLGHLPQKLPSGLFNCSRDDYPSFRQHLHCNLDLECEEGQDETGDCPYSSDQCRGQLASGTKCFFMVGLGRVRHNTSSWQRTALDAKVPMITFDIDPIPDFLKSDYIYSGYQKVSWNAAARECEEGNGRLAAFTTDEQWQDVLKLWTYSKVTLTSVFVGLKTTWKQEPLMYRYALKSSDGTLVYFMRQIKEVKFRPSSNTLRPCAIVLVNLARQELIVELVSCIDESMGLLGICERTVLVNDSYGNSSEVLSANQWSTPQPAVAFHSVTRNATTIINSLCDSRTNYTLVVCPCGHVTHSFLSCDLHSYCGEERYVDECPVLSPAHCRSRCRQWAAQYEQYTAETHPTNTVSDMPLSPYPCSDYVHDGRDHGTSVAMFICVNQETVHYSLVCDFKPDCPDGSDESFCFHPPCSGFTCMNRQCVPKRYKCDGKVHCLDDSDESQCSTERLHFITAEELLKQPPGLIDLTGSGNYVLSNWSRRQPCPDTHYRCTSHPRYCVPIYTRCNGYFDCAGREDESDCDDVRCLGLYRCRGSRVCVHVRHMCDGWPQCPQHDDEWQCQATPCPESCLCQGQAFVCHGPFPPSDYPDLRYLSMDSTPMTLSSFSHNVYLIYLSLVRCQVFILAQGVKLPNVQILDVSSNHITTLNMTIFEELPNIKELRLAHNPIVDMVSGVNDTYVSALEVADLSNTLLETFSTHNLSFYSHVKRLNLSNSQVNTIGDAGFQFSPALEVLDMRGCFLTRFRLDMFRGLQRLSVVFSPNYRLCCHGVLPDLVINTTCIASPDRLSSCEDLLKSRWYQGALFAISIVATVGSAVCLISRNVQHPRLSGCEMLLSNIYAASVLMGLYAGVIAVADEIYRGRYVLREYEWSESVTCQTACFLHFLSHQVLVLTMLVISLDRLVILYFPYHRLRLNAVSAAAACIITWCIGVVVAVVPSASAWPLHQQSPLCVPLPAPTTRFPGDYFQFGAVILQTVIVSSLVVLCQGLVFLRLKQRGDVCLSTASEDVVFAARIYLVALVNALCWLSVSVYGVVAQQDATFAESPLSVVLVMLLYPLPAAFSPVALTYRRMQEDKRRDVEMKILLLLRLRARRAARAT